MPLSVQGGAAAGTRKLTGVWPGEQDQLSGKEAGR